MKGLLLGMALGYLAFTENGHQLGNKAADVIVKNAKKTAEGYLNGLFGGKPDGKDGEDEDHKEDREDD